MKFVSSVQPNQGLSLSQVILKSMPPQGGLYVPTTFPSVPVYSPTVSYVDYATALLELFSLEDILHNQMSALCQRAFSFKPALQTLSPQVSLLELFHGPSLSFKDFGAQFLANAISVLPSVKERLVLVATSGDTGSAVAAAFHQKPNVKVVVLYPEYGVSQRQAHQLSCWGGNVTTYAVQGNFDQCQTMVKTALQDDDIADWYNVTTANSINVGRLLPQVVYYAFISAQYQYQHGGVMNLVVPSGNLGNVTAACWAKAMGAPIGHVVIAQNDNCFVVDYINTGEMKPRSSVATIANAMDVGSPSNFLRLSNLYSDHSLFCDSLRAYTVRDSAIREAIVDTYRRYNMVVCPHTAVGMAVLPQLQCLDSRGWVVAATAHAAKFETVVEPLLNVSIPLPSRFQLQLKRPRCDRSLACDYASLKSKILLMQDVKSS